MTCCINHPFFVTFQRQNTSILFQKIIFGKATKNISTQTLNFPVKYKIDIKEVCLCIWRDMITFSFLFTFSGELWCLCDFHLWENCNFRNFLLTKIENQNTWLEAFYLIEGFGYIQIFFLFSISTNKKKKQICCGFQFIKLCVSNQLIVGLWYANFN